jgi:hypothetical protein
MSDNNGWPDPARPGVPLNPERDGWHWVCAAVGIAAPYPMLWCADGKAWDTGDGWEFCTSPRMTERTRYLRPCSPEDLSPAEVEARIATARKEWLAELNHDTDALMENARRDALEEAAQREMPPEFLEWMKRQMPKGTVIGNPEWWASRIWQAAIRALAEKEILSEDIIRADRDAWPDHQANDPIRALKGEGND